MAPTASPPRRKARENQYFDLGVRGRKTGLMLPDTGIRDEHGLEPMDRLFSSPEKPGIAQQNGTHKNLNLTMSAEEDMDVPNSSVPEPEVVLTERKRATMKMPLPRSKSPIKTHLQSPAKRNPTSRQGSPARGSFRSQMSSSPPEPVRRKLEFSNVDEANALHTSPTTRRRGLANPANGIRLKSPQIADFSDDDSGKGMETAPENNILKPAPSGMNGDDHDGRIDDLDEDLVIREGSEAKLGQPKDANNVKATGTALQSKRNGKRGRPRKQPETEAGHSAVVEEHEDKQIDEPETRPAKRPRRSPDYTSIPEGKAKASAVKKSKTAGRKPRLAPITEDEAITPEVQPRPPLPRANRGLYILRRETPSGGTGFNQTRSGRNSIKPLNWWAGEKVEYDDTAIKDGDRSILVHQIKEVVRADQVEITGHQRSKSSKANKSKLKSKSKMVKEDADSDMELMEPWEIEPGRIDGFVRDWNPDDPAGEETPESAELIAYASAALTTRQVKDATFGFSKTLTMPFFGAGVVDLPPGAIKKTKNTRRMHMVFFLHYGRVRATVNGNTFSIGQGGQWMVPRGNFYSIANDYDKPARIFFSQANEVSEGASASEVAGGSQS